MLRNLLANPSLEGAYIEQGAPELKLAPGWSPSFRYGEPAPGGPQDSEHFCARPEYKPILRAQHPHRVQAGDTAQCAFVRWHVMDACILQRVPVPVGRLLTARAFVQGWSSDSDNPSQCDGELYFRLGLDLDGDADPFHPIFIDSCLWSDWQRATPDYEQIELQAEATQPYATMIVNFWNKYRLAHNDAYIDDLALLADDGDQPIPNGHNCVTKAEFAAMLRTAANVIAPT